MKSNSVYSSYLILLFLVVAALPLVYFRYNIIFSYSPDVSGSEKNIIYGIQRLLAGLPLYTDPTQIEFNLIQYTPLYFRVTSMICYLFGIQSGDPYSIYVVSRTVSLFLVLSSILFYCAVLKRLKFDYLSCFSLAIILLYLHSANILSNSRPDSLLSFFIALFFYSGIRSVQSRHYLWNILAIISALLAFWSKQNGIVLMGCWLLFTMISGGVLKSFLYLILFVIAIAFLLLSEQTDLEILKLNLIDGLRNSIHFEEFRLWIVNRLWPFLPIIFLSLFFCFQWLDFTDQQPQRVKLFILISCLALLFFNFASSLKLGSRIGYLTDYLCVAFTASYIYIRDLIAQKRIDHRYVSRSLKILWIWSVIPLGFISFKFVNAFADPVNLERYKSEKDLAEHFRKYIAPSHPDARLIVFENYIEGQWTKLFLFSRVSAFAHDALDMSPFNYSVFPELIVEGKIRYAISFSKSPLKLFDFDLNDASLLDNFQGKEIYDLTGSGSPVSFIEF